MSLCDMCTSREKESAKRAGAFGATLEHRQCFDAQYRGVHQFRDDSKQLQQVTIICSNFRSTDEDLASRPTDASTTILPVLTEARLRVDRCVECGGDIIHDGEPSYDLCYACRRRCILVASYLDHAPFRVWVRKTVRSRKTSAAWMAIPGLLLRQTDSRVLIRVWHDWPGMRRVQKDVWDTIESGRIYVRARRVQQDGKDNDS